MCAVAFILPHPLHQSNPRNCDGNGLSLRLSFSEEYVPLSVVLLHEMLKAHHYSWEWRVADSRLVQIICFTLTKDGIDDVPPGM